jgi:hypothetical protein
MSSKSLPAKLTRGWQALRTNAGTPPRFWLLLRMVLWAIVLRLLRPFVSLQRLVHFAAPGAPGREIEPADAVSCLHLLDYSGLLPKTGLCLPRALVCYRYLALAGLEPTLLIGFDGHLGHAWVELSGQPFLESPATLRPYRPALTLPPAHRTLQKLPPNA